MGSPVQNTSYVADGQALLISQYQQPKIRAVLAAYLKRLQECEDAAFTMLLAMSIDAATGDLLDKYGILVGEPRIARADVDYRLALRIRIRVNRSAGRVTDILDVLALTALDYSFAEHFPAGFRIEVFATTNGPALANLLFTAKPAGVRAVVVYTTTSRAGTWGVDSSGTAGVAGNVYASTTDLSLGFGLASCRSS